MTGARERVVVVTGGRTEDYEILSSTELLFVDSNLAWIKGPELTFIPITMIEFEGSVIVTGGLGEKKMYQLSSAKDDWKMMPQSLSKEPMSWHVAFLIPDTLANCSEKTN